jgi:hypothetical protein
VTRILITYSASQPRIEFSLDFAWWQLMNRMLFHDSPRVIRVALVLSVLLLEAHSVTAYPQSADHLLIPVRSGHGEKWGYVDEIGRVVIPFQFDLAWEFHEDRALVWKKDKCGFIDSKGTLRIPYQSCYTWEGFHDGFAVINRHRRGKSWYIDRDGRRLKSDKFYMAGTFSEGLADVATGSFEKRLWGYIDKTGQFAIQPGFEDFPGRFSEGVAYARLGGKVGFIDRSGKFTIPPQFEKADDFNEGLAPVALNGKWGFIDHYGKWIIEPRFDSARSFTEGLAVVGIDSQVGFVDKTGAVIIKPDYKQAVPFQDGYASVVNGTVGAIDRQGNVVLPVYFSEAAYIGRGLWDVFTEGERRIIDVHQNVIYKYDARDQNCIRQNPRFPRESDVSISITPTRATLHVNETVQFRATLIGFTRPTPSFDTQAGPEPQKALNGCMYSDPPDFTNCSSGVVIVNRQSGRTANRRSLVTYYAPPFPGTYYIVYEAWQSEGCNGNGFIEKWAIAEATVLP